MWRGSGSHGRWRVGAAPPRRSLQFCKVPFQHKHWSRQSLDPSWMTQRCSHC